MDKSVEFSVGERSITAKQLSPRQVDTLLGTSGTEKPGDSLALLMDSDITTEAVVMSTGLSREELLDQLSLQELAEIWPKVEEVNDFLLERLQKAFSKSMKILAEAPGKS